MNTIVKRWSRVFLFFGLFWGLAGASAGCMHFHSFPAKIERKVQPLYDGLARLDPEATYVFVALDGVSYEMARDLKRAGHFPSFAPPVRMIATFPSTTIVGFTGLFQPLDCDIPQGYETKFFSQAENRLRGHTWRDYRNILIPFKQFFNYYRYTLWHKLTMYAVPGATVRRDLDRIRSRVLSEDKPSFLMAYIGGTDGAAHVLGRRRLGLLVEMVEKELERLRRDFSKRHGRPLHFLLYSDHGFHFSPDLKSIPVTRVRSHLENQGFAWVEHLKKRRDFVAVPFGNLSSGVFYTALADAEEFADALVSVPGVDLVFYRKSPHEIGVYSHTGAWALIQEKEDGAWFRYIPVTGDPLNYSPLLSHLPPYARSFEDPSPWLPRDTWWELSKESGYPDAFQRLHDAFSRLVVNHAQVIMSTLPDFEYGSTEARIGANIHSGLKGTHGGIFAETSSAFAITTIPGLDFPDVISYRDLFEIINRVSPSKN